MRIYELQPDGERYRSLTLVEELGFNLLADLTEPGSGRAWTPLTAEWIYDDLNAGLAKSDFPTLGSTPVFSARAVDELVDLLVENGELLPLSLSDGAYFVYRTVRLLDALDEDRSELVRFSSSGRVMRVVKYAFHENVSFPPVFQIPQLRVTVFVSENFVQRVMESGLTGFAFKPVWDSEHPHATRS